MKSLFIVLIITLLLLSPIGVSASPAGDLIDGVFEQWSGSNTLTHWKFKGNGGTLESATGRTGTGYCANITANSDSNPPHLNTSLGTVSEDETLSFSIYVRGNGFGVNFNFVIVWCDGDAEVSNEYLFGFGNIPVTWTQYSTTVATTVPSGINNATIWIFTSYGDRRASGAGYEPNQDIDYWILIDDCVASGSGIAEFPLSTVMILSSSFIVALAIGIRKRNR